MARPTRAGQPAVKLISASLKEAQDMKMKQTELINLLVPMKIASRTTFYRTIKKLDCFTTTLEETEDGRKQKFVQLLDIENFISKEAEKRILKNLGSSNLDIHEAAAIYFTDLALKKKIPLVVVKHVIHKLNAEKSARVKGILMSGLNDVMKKQKDITDMVRKELYEQAKKSLRIESDIELRSYSLRILGNLRDDAAIGELFKIVRESDHDTYDRLSDSVIICLKSLFPYFSEKIIDNIFKLLDSGNNTELIGRAKGLHQIISNQMCNK